MTSTQPPIKKRCGSPFTFNGIWVINSTTAGASFAVVSLMGHVLCFICSHLLMSHQNRQHQSSNQTTMVTFTSRELSLRENILIFSSLKFS